MDTKNESRFGERKRVRVCGKFRVISYRFAFLLTFERFNVEWISAIEVY